MRDPISDIRWTAARVVVLCFAVTLGLLAGLLVVWNTGDDEIGPPASVPAASTTTR